MGYYPEYIINSYRSIKKDNTVGKSGKYSMGNFRENKIQMTNKYKMHNRPNYQ